VTVDFRAMFVDSAGTALLSLPASVVAQPRSYIEQAAIALLLGSLFPVLRAGFAFAAEWLTLKTEEVRKKRENGGTKERRKRTVTGGHRNAGDSARERERERDE